MNVAGAIHSAGSRPLKEFTWGEIVVNIINSLVEDPVPPVTIDSTGKSIIKLLDKMSNKEKNIILSYPISSIDADGEFIINHEVHQPKSNDVHWIGLILLMIIISGVSTFIPMITNNNPDGITNVFDVAINIIKQFL